MSHDQIKKTSKSRVRRMPQRGIYERNSINSIIDNNPICHVSFVVDNEPIIIPMAHWRDGNYLYIHGAKKGRIISSCMGASVCIAITSFDGFVLARSAYNHSMNYSSVVIHGKAESVDDPQEIVNQLRNFVEHHFPGRWDQLRPVKQEELAETALLRIPIEEATAKVRSGPPGDENDDPDWKVWTGLIAPNRKIVDIIRDPTMASDVSDPDYITKFVTATTGTDQDE